MKEFRTAVRRTAPFYFVIWASACGWTLFVIGRQTFRHPTLAPFATLSAIIVVHTTIHIYRLFYRERIEVSPSGLSYFNVQYELSVPWAQAASLVHKKLLLFWPRTELRVTSPSIRRNLWFDWGTIAPLRKREAIPLGPGIWEHEADLLQEIHRYAPHVKAAA